MKFYIYFLFCCFLPIALGEKAFRRNPLTVANPVYAINHHAFEIQEIAHETKLFIDQLPMSFYSGNHSRYGNSTDKCIDSIALMLADLIHDERYPFFVLDSWGKLESGLLFGSYRWLGSYRECIAAQSASFKGKYCILSLQNAKLQNAFIPSSAPSFQLGACLPDVCPLTHLLKRLQYFDKNITISCPEQYTEWKTVDIVALVVCILLGVLCISATAIHNYVIYINQQSYIPLDDNDLNASSDDISLLVSVNNSGLLWKLSSAFSILSNIRIIFNTKQKQGEIRCLHGLRFISISWVIIGHCLLLVFYFTGNSFSIVKYIVEHWEFQAITNATFAVDTFFFLSGLLVCYLGSRNLVRTGGRMNVGKQYFSRYLRITPLYGFVLLILVSLYLKVIDGPLWPDFIYESIETCSKHWYTNLLYINNIYPANIVDECYAIGWYLSNDFQFFLIAPLFLFLLHRKPMLGISIMSLVVLASSVVTGILSTITQQQPQGEMFGIISQYVYSMVYGLTYNITPVNPQLGENQYLSDIYTKPWCRIGAYVIGMMTGYFLHVNNNELKLNKITAAAGWVLTAGISCSIIYCLYPSFSNGYQLDVNTAAFYNAVSRPLWSICMAWVTIACTTGYGGLINSFLSWKGFVPLSRLTFGLYLLHPLVVWWFLASNDKLFNFTIQSYVLLCIGTLVVTTAIALICAVFVEYPIMQLAKSSMKEKTT